MKYMHCSMFGSYWIPCEVVDWDFGTDTTEKLQKMFEITYTDPYSREIMRSWVDECRVDKEDEE